MHGLKLAQTPFFLPSSLLASFLKDLYVHQAHPPTQVPGHAPGRGRAFPPVVLFFALVFVNYIPETLCPFPDGLDSEGAEDNHRRWPKGH